MILTQILVENQKLNILRIIDIFAVETNLLGVFLDILLQDMMTCKTSKLLVRKMQKAELE